jgi:hypothetical protein
MGAFVSARVNHLCSYLFRGYSAIAVTMAIVLSDSEKIGVSIGTIQLCRGRGVNCELSRFEG